MSVESTDVENKDFSTDKKKKKALTAYLLLFLLGEVEAHQFYLGRKKLL